MTAPGCCIWCREPLEWGEAEEAMTLRTAGRRRYLCPAAPDALHALAVLGDLYCGAGGAARGYQQAGFYVIGVDHQPQPRYAGSEFVLRDALEALADPAFMGRLDAAHASPPCQARSQGSARDNDHPQLIGPTRSALLAWGGLWVIENVPSRRRVEYLRPDLVICGCLVGIDRLERERWFETSWGAFELRSPCTQHSGPVVTVLAHGARVEVSRGTGPHRPRYFPQADAGALMGIDWMTQPELGEAIPPAYTRRVGALIMAEIRAARQTRQACGSQCGSHDGIDADRNADRKEA